MRWKIDDNEELPLAIIEDTEDGAGIAEIGERTERNLAIAAEIVESHNPLATPASTARTDGWVSVEERLPDEMVNVLWGKPDDYEHNCTVDEIRQDSHPEDYYTHWQPLPAAPGSVPQAPELPK